MKRRELMNLAALGAAAGPALAFARPQPARPAGPALLTVTGAVARPNRRPFDPVFDQLMGKQQVRFEKGHAFDFGALAALPAVNIRPTLEYDGKPHQLGGPLLTDVLEAAGAPAGDGARLLLRALDGYAVQLSGAEARRYRFIVATHLDGQPLPLGGLGPLWAVYDADRFPDMAAQPVQGRFARCPWGLYHIEAQPAA